MIGPFTPDNVNLWTKSIVKNLKHGGKYHRHLYDWVSCDDIDNAEVSLTHYVDVHLACSLH